MAHLMRLSALVLGLGFLGSGHGDPLDTATSALPDSAQGRFEFLDANRDGVLSKYEYDRDIVFEVADTDHDQLLSPQELDSALGPQAEDAPTTPDRMIAVDLDRDGLLNDAELRRAMELRFSWLDRNKDGGLDFDEMKAGLGVRVRP